MKSTDKEILSRTFIGIYAAEPLPDRLLGDVLRMTNSIIILLIPLSVQKEILPQLEGSQLILVSGDRGPAPLNEGRIYYSDPELFPQISDGHLVSRQYCGLLSPADCFFKSVAENYGPRGTGIVVGRQGKTGLTLIKGAGGVVYGSKSFLKEFADMAELVLPLEDFDLQPVKLAKGNKRSGKNDRLKELKKRALTREKQQEVVAELSLLALSGVEPDELFQTALERVVETLGADYGKILKHQPEQHNFLLINGVGWKERKAGEVTVPDSRDSQAGFTLMREDTIIVQDIHKETRFTGSPLFKDHQVVSGMSCVINHSDPVFGVFGVHTKRERIFTQDDANFLLSVANMLSTALKYKRIREQLNKSESQFRTMANSIPQLAWMTDANGWIFWYNDRWFNYTGTTLEEMEGWGWMQVHHPDHVDRVVKKLKKAFENKEEWEDTFPLRKYDGSYRWFLSRARPIRNEAGEVINWFGTNTDITQQLETEKAFYESEQKLRIAKNSGNVGTFEYFLQVEKTEWDAMLKLIWGIPLEDKVTQEDFWSGVHEDDREETRKAIAKASDPTGDGHYWCEYRVVNMKTGEIAYVESSGQVLFQDGVPEKMIGLVIDITARKELENSLQNAVRELENTNAKKNEFLATLGHELRNPLASISGGIQLLQLENEHLEELRIMSHGVSQMSSLLDDLLDLTRIERGKIRLDKRPVNLSSIYLSVVQSNRSLMERKEQEFIIKAPPPNLVVNADGTRMEQIISNLLTNAYKFTPKGGRITVSLEKGATGNAILTISDTGIGLSSEMKQRIFDPFEQVENPENRGLGIGLSLVRQFVEMHGGTIHVFSAGLDKGSEFIVEIPVLHDMTPVINDPDPVTQDIIRQDLSILIVEDNKDAARGLEALLKKSGCHVRTAVSAEDTLQQLADYSPEVLIMDIGLPDMSGYELIRKVKEILPDAVFIAHTGYGHLSAQLKSKSAGFDYHLNKPVKLSDLVQILNKV